MSTKPADEFETIAVETLESHALSARAIADVPGLVAAHGDVNALAIILGRATGTARDIEDAIAGLPLALHSDSAARVRTAGDAVMAVASALTDAARELAPTGGELAVSALNAASHLLATASNNTRDAADRA